MHKPNRDLLVLFNQEIMNPKAIEHEVVHLHELLYTVEKVESLIRVYEIININKYRITNKPSVLRNFLRKRETKPFVFLNCKN